MNKLPEKLIQESTFTERRLIIYLLGKKGKGPGVLLKNPGPDKDARLKCLINLVNRGIMKIVSFDTKNVYFKFTDKFASRKISVSIGCYID
jgi:hypothetical protein